MRKRYILTGGIASGKSTVSNLLKLHNIEIIDADKISKNVFSRNIKKIQEIFDTTLTGNKLRAFIADIIFTNPKDKLRFEQFIHPKIRNIIAKKEKALQVKNILYVVDIPLYFETKQFKEDDFVILVKVSYEIQLTRLIKRNGLTKEEANKRILSQLPTAIKEKHAKYIIDNSKTIEELSKQVKNLITYIKEDYNENSL